MVAHVVPASRFAVSLWRHDEIVDVRTAPTGREAVKVALLMIVQQDALENGDKLTVTES